MAAALWLNPAVLNKIPATANLKASSVAALYHPTICKRLIRRPKTHVRAIPTRRARWSASRPAARADDSSAPSDMSVENALELLGVREGASFDEILRAKNAIIASCKDNQDAIAQVETAYDMLLMQSLSQRRSGKVANSNIRYADVKVVRSPGAGGALSEWIKSVVKNVPISIESPTSDGLGIQSGVYGALMVFTFVSGTSPNSAGIYSGADVPGLILATSFGASLFFLTKRSIRAGKATLMTASGLAVGAVVGSAVENCLQVDVVPFLGIHSPAVIVSEFILFSQLLVSLYLS
ncbi:hypothetical protein KSP40_PGU016350 [Platanthera guangdongensis]|uniref:Protein CHAPERONE-LIKE PROTEIN OF POR1, chloroplastic n=1 Tax=Platanthera guangdongensis TaxID=2320717 RepID=A0ABR2MLQ0_9ASPA